MSDTQKEIVIHASLARRLAFEAESRLEENAVEAAELAAISQAHGLAAIATALGEGFLSAEVELVKFAGGSTPSSVPASAVPAKVCACGHSSSDHGLAGGGAPAGSLGGCKWCTCVEFRKPYSTQPAVVPGINSPEPSTPAKGVLLPNQRVMAVPTEGHVWPEVLKTVVGAPYVNVTGQVVEIDREADLVKVICDAIGTGVGRAGPTVQLHREQLRIPAPGAS